MRAQQGLRDPEQAVYLSSVRHHVVAMEKILLRPAKDLLTDFGTLIDDVKELADLYGWNVVHESV